MKKGYFKSSITVLPKVMCFKAKNNRPCWALRKKITELCVHTLVFYPISMVITQNNIDITQGFPALLQIFCTSHMNIRSHKYTYTPRLEQNQRSDACGFGSGLHIWQDTIHHAVFLFHSVTLLAGAGELQKRSRCVYWEPNFWVDTKTQIERKGLTLAA